MSSIYYKSIILSSGLFSSIYLFSLSLKQINKLLKMINENELSLNKNYLTSLLFFNGTIFCGSGIIFCYTVYKSIRMI